MIGIFVGPVVLAVAYTLLDEWVLEGDREPSDDVAGPVRPVQNAIAPPPL